ncbi:transmembrane protein 109 isoform X1 [Betta splendens]|uniref:Transmembrane protein 109 isoform X1 n=1 Tax=Betta splendens TaxID=158456 RepID=A0A6P7M0S8_BETSP|nr:transmembrane protein 109 isoform X1 [Betta splendens]
MASPTPPTEQSPCSQQGATSPSSPTERTRWSQCGQQGAESPPSPPTNFFPHPVVLRELASSGLLHHVARTKRRRPAVFARRPAAVRLGGDDVRESLRDDPGAAERPGGAGRAGEDPAGQAGRGADAAVGAEGGAAAVLNLLLQYVSQLLQAAGVQVVLPLNRVTPEGLTFVLQWVLAALVGYWLLSLLLRLLASALRRTLWLLKVGLALVGFGLILSDPGVGTETMAARLAVLVCVCVLLGVGPSRGPDVAEKTARLEQQVRILEKRLREMERRRKTNG